MTTILPKGEHIRRAVKWISEERQRNLGKTFLTIVDQAALRFDLSPNESDSLMRMLRDGEKLR